MSKTLRGFLAGLAALLACMATIAVQAQNRGFGSPYESGQAHPGGAAVRPSQRMTPQGLPRNNAPVVDPFVARGGDPAGNLLPDPKGEAKGFILEARRALGQNDLARAIYFYHKAAERPASFGPNEDSPQRLAEDIRRLGGDLSGSPAGGAARQPPASQPVAPPQRAPWAADARTAPQPVNPAARAQADQLLLAARRALADSDVRRAAGLVGQARALDAPYGPLDDSPDRVEAAVNNYRDLMAQEPERGGTEVFRRQQARLLMDQAEALLHRQDFETAQRLAGDAANLRCTFSPYEKRPDKLLEHIAAMRRQNRPPLGNEPGPANPLAAVPRSEVRQASAEENPWNNRASAAVYDAALDRTRNIPASAAEAGAAQASDGSEVRPPAAPAVPLPPIDPSAPGSGRALVAQGEAALRAHEPETALRLFQQAHFHAHELDPATAQRLRDHLQNLTAQSRPRSGPGGGVIDEAVAKQQALAQRTAADVGRQVAAAAKLRETDPKAALAVLEQARAKVESAGLEPALRDRMLRQLDRDLADARKFIESNRARIELAEQNQHVEQAIEREQKHNIEVQTKIARKVEEFNDLVQERRFAEAELVAKQVIELDPKNPVAPQLAHNAKMLRRVASNSQLRDEKEEGFWKQMDSVEWTAVGFDDRNPYVHGDAREWRQLSDQRLRKMKDGSRRLSERELEIRQKLKTPVAVHFQNTPLAKAIETLGKLADVNIHLDAQGLADEAITTDMPVNLDLRAEISLQSALNLILGPMRLSHMIKDEVLKITSEQHRSGDLYTQTYNVADLVIPIPNFTPSGGLGLEPAYRQALSSVGFNAPAGPFGASGMAPAVIPGLAGHDSRQGRSSLDPTVLAQSLPGRGPVPGATPVAGGPGGMGGGSNADFESLIDLIVTTIEPDSWAEAGGQGNVAEFAINNSLVISQTQDVHEKIADLLEQLRRLQDLQVTIEVRFITLNDNFFERIGVDFVFDVKSNAPQDLKAVKTQDIARPSDPSLTAGLSKGFGGAIPSATGFTPDLDIAFTQNSFGLAQPGFGALGAENAGAQLGFAILSDIEAYFFIQAAQGDRRTNVLQAPKVTLFNGQQAFVSDTSQSPFVISVVPVVGEFAAAQQPVIVVLNEGTFLTVQAVVSNDRRFVRLTVVPFFSQINKVDTFKFTGSTTTTTDSDLEGVQDNPNNNTRRRNARTTTNEGTTVQLPTFSFVTVTTTVSVPDGGTVLLGGIKRLREARNEGGVPILNKIPYLNRLFKNVGIGRETQSLMMMVTPRIIIQEEEEQKIGMPAP